MTITRKKEPIELIHDYMDVNSLSTASSVCRTWLQLLQPSTRKARVATSTSLQTLSKGALKWLMNDKDFMMSLNDAAFKRFIISSDLAAQYALETPFIVQRLDSLPNTTQLYTQSCAARVIMLIERTHGFISAEEYRNSRELDIYRSIWMNPGIGSSPEKIVAYLSRRHFSFEAFEIADLTKKIRDTLQHKQTDYLYSLFSRASSVTPTSPSAIDNLFGELDTAMFITNPNVEGMEVPAHVIFAQCINKMLYTWDPTKERTTYSSFSDFIDNYPNFTGVGYIVRRQINPRPTMIVDNNDTEQKPFPPPISP